MIRAVDGTGFDSILCLHDEAVELGALIAEKLGLPFASPDVTHRTVNKSAMRARLAAAGLGSVAHGVVVDDRIVWSGTTPTSEIVSKVRRWPGQQRRDIHRSANELQRVLGTRRESSKVTWQKSGRSAGNSVSSL